jgi:hypothetical protein
MSAIILVLQCVSWLNHMVFVSPTSLASLEETTVNDCLFLLAAQYLGKRGTTNRERIRKVIAAEHTA